MTGSLSPAPILQFFGNSGEPLSGGFVLTTVGGVNTATYQDVNLTIPLPNPIPLNSRGEVSTAAGASAQCFLSPTVAYTFTLYDGSPSTPPYGNQVNQASYVTGALSTGDQVAGLLQTVTDTPILASYKQTQAEISASVTPSNYTYLNGPSRYGATGGGVIDDQPAWASVGKVNGYHFVYDGQYLINEKIQTSALITVEGSTRGNTVLIAGSALTDYVLEIGNAPTGPNPNLGELRRLKFTSAAVLSGPVVPGLLHMNQTSHLWHLDSLYFQFANGPALVIDNCSESHYDNIDIYSCCVQNGVVASADSSVIVKNGCGNIYFKTLHVEGCGAGGLYVDGTSGGIHVLSGKIENGFQGGQTATAAITTAGQLNMTDVFVTGQLMYQYNVTGSSGELLLNSCLMDGGAGVAASILDQRAWTHLDTVTFPGITGPDIGPFIGRIGLGRSRFSRTNSSVSTTTPAVIRSKVFPVRLLQNTSIASTGSTSGNSIQVQLGSPITYNDQYTGCYLVHNGTGTQPGARRKIIQCFAGGLTVLQGTNAPTVDSDWSIEYAGGNYTPFLEADSVLMQNGMDLFQQISVGCTISGTPTYQTSTGQPSYGCTYFGIVGTGLAPSFDLTGFYLIDEVTGEPFLIGYGIDGAGNIGVMYDRTATINTSHTFTVQAGYYAGIHLRGDYYEWTFAGQKQTVMVTAADYAGFDINNMPLWGFGPLGNPSSANAVTGAPITLPYSATMALDASAGNEFIIVASNGSNFTISNPTNPKQGQLIWITISNTSGGSLGTVTWGNKFKVPSGIAYAANGFQRTYAYRYDGTNWYYVTAAGSDVPN